MCTCEVKKAVHQQQELSDEMKGLRQLKHDCS